jgi:hypothetical protein
MNIQVADYVYTMLMQTTASPWARQMGCQAAIELNSPRLLHNYMINPSTCEIGQDKGVINLVTALG